MCQYHSSIFIFNTVTCYSPKWYDTSLSSSKIVKFKGRNRSNNKLYFTLELAQNPCYISWNMSKTFMINLIKKKKLYIHKSLLSGFIITLLQQWTKLDHFRLLDHIQRLKRNYSMPDIYFMSVLNITCLI